MAETYLFFKLFSPNTFYLANSPSINPTKHSPYTVFNQSYEVQIIPLVIYGLGCGHTQACIHIRIKVISGKWAQAGLRLGCAWFKTTPV